MSRKVIILGGTGNGTVIAHAMIDARNRGQGEWEFSGFLNDRTVSGTSIEELPVLGRIKDAPAYVDKGYYFINTIYRIDGQKERIDLFESLSIPEERLATFVHPETYQATDVHLEPGVVLMPLTGISAGVSIGKGSLIMVGATIGHNTRIGAYCHIAAQACLSSFCIIGRGVHIGLNASVRENITMEDFSALGMGSVLLQNAGTQEIWAGNPARFLRRSDD
ncbi:MAG: hypothetical protein JXB60_05570 [Candidatus Cloacimonetes bacterium]|nr:hypothetical protein [Candidatus Cloacimonadota bacterium]